MVEPHQILAFGPAFVTVLQPCSALTQLLVVSHGSLGCERRDDACLYCHSRDGIRISRTSGSWVFAGLVVQWNGETDGRAWALLSHSGKRVRDREEKQAEVDARRIVPHGVRCFVARMSLGKLLAMLPTTW